MKILLIGNYAPDQQESMQRFARLLERELSQRGHRVRLLQPRARLNRRGAPPVGLAKWLGYLDKFVLFPFLLRRAARRADVVHITDHSNAMYVRHLRHRSLLLTCNDVLAIRSALGLIPQNRVGAGGKILQKLILRGLNRAPHIACISHNTRQQLLEVSTRAPVATTVIEMGLNYPYAPMPQAEAISHGHALLGERASEALERGFILHVGGDFWYKNRIGVVRIYHRFTCASDAATGHPLLIFVGKPLDEASRAWVQTHGLEPDVLRIEGPSNEELRALYSLAQALLFPSLAEGFGWPIAEAQACGCRVVTTGEAPMTEVGGGAAVYIDPADEAAAANRLRELLNETAAEKHARVEAGLRHAQRFSTRQMVDSYVRAYENIRIADGR